MCNLNVVMKEVVDRKFQLGNVQMMKQQQQQRLPRLDWDHRHRGNDDEGVAVSYYYYCRSWLEPIKIVVWREKKKK